MTRRRTTLALAVLLLIPGLWPAASARQASPPRIVAIGDIHGGFEPFVQILQAAGLIGPTRQWSGGQTVLVQTGDVFDRGTGVKSALDLLMQLEDQAKRAGGRVEALLGNHEVMNILGDYRDVNPETYAAFADSRSEDRRKRAYDDYVKVAKRTKSATIQSREEWMTAHPAGFVEYMDAMGPRGKYGKWLRSHKVVVALNDTGFMHAGVNPDSSVTLDEVNRTAQNEIATWDESRSMLVAAQVAPAYGTLNETVAAGVAELQRIVTALQAKENPGEHVTRELVEKLQNLATLDKWSLIAADGPLWFRGFALWPDEDEPRVTSLLQRLNLKRFVTAHTPQLPGKIRSRFGNRIFLIDTGMLSTYFKGGRASALELEGTRVTAIYPDAKDVIVPGAAAHLLPAPLDERLAGAAATAASASSR